jgi:hypothetical protein
MSVTMLLELNWVMRGFHALRHRDIVKVMRTLGSTTMILETGSRPGRQPQQLAGQESIG